MSKFIVSNVKRLKGWESEECMAHVSDIIEVQIHCSEFGKQ